MKDTPFKVVIVDDHTFVAESLAHAIAARGNSLVQVMHPDEPGVVPTVLRLRPDLALVDLKRADGSIFGLDLIASLHSGGLRSVAFTGTEDEALLGEALERGAVGVVNKALPFEATLAAITAALAGDPVTNDGDSYRWLLAALRKREERKQALAPFLSLTRREQAVLGSLIAGSTPEEIAETSFVSIVTIRSQIRTMFAKLGVHSQIAAVAKARQAGWEPTTVS
jgi:two-component system, NarL family, nitrate/nitrite response regulator NarL